jgi:hypothetical protein
MELADFEDVHDGDRAFILGNGPSLNDTPLSKLQDEWTFGVNEISRIYDSTDWRPSYFLTRDVQSHGVSYIQDTIDIGIPCFIAEDNILLEKTNRELFGERSNIFYLNVEPVPQADRDRVFDEIAPEEIWSTDITERTYAFGSIVGMAAQIAAYMGFDEIYFVGTDLYEPATKHMLFQDGGDPSYIRSGSKSTLTTGFKFVTESDHPVKTLVNTLAFLYYTRMPDSISYKHNSHFSLDYDSSYTKGWPNEKLRFVHRVIKAVSEKSDFEVYNATVGGRLEVYERVDIEELL